ncbi:MAG: hypothetical protein ACP5HQ_09110, partial [Thermoprotei archaeon]
MPARGKRGLVAGGRPLVSDYSKSGVDLGKLRQYHEIAKAYFKAGEVGVGHYANAVKLGDYYLSIHV